MKSMIRILAIALAIAACAHGGDRVYKQPSEFIKQSFGGKIPATSVLNLSGAVKSVFPPAA